MLTLYERVNYLNKNISHLVNKEIIEYDMKEAGFNIIRTFDLLDQYTIQRLTKLTKYERTIEIGKIQRANKKFRHDFKTAFIGVRKMFMEGNNLTDTDILSVKNDAIFTLKTCPNTTFGEHIRFIPTYYTSYYYMGGVEFYYHPLFTDVKGISDDNLRKHEGYMIDVLNTYFRFNEEGNTSRSIAFTKDLLYYYKRRELDVGYYRELNVDSMFRIKSPYSNFDRSVLIDYMDNTNESLVDIAYNFNNYIIPMIRILN